MSQTMTRSQRVQNCATLTKTKKKQAMRTKREDKAYKDKEKEKEKEAKRLKREDLANRDKEKEKEKEA